MSFPALSGRTSVRWARLDMGALARAKGKKMLFEAKEEMPADPSYWFSEADRYARDAQAMLESRKISRAQVVNCLHAMLERDLKGLLCFDGLLSDGDRTHNLKLLAEKQGVYMSMPAGAKVFLCSIANAHARATYPGECAPWDDDRKYANIVLGAFKLHGYLKGKVHAGECRGGENDE